MAKIEKSLESGPQFIFQFYMYVPQLFLGAPQVEKMAFSPIILTEKVVTHLGTIKKSKMCLRLSVLCALVERSKGLVGPPLVQ